MTLNPGPVPLALALCLLLPLGAQAQSSDQCYQAASDLCGDLTYGQCFAASENWDYLPEGCDGDIQRQIEMDREFEEQANADAQAETDMQTQNEMAREFQEQQQSGGGWQTATAWGGKMRAGPGTDYQQIGSLREGDGIEILAETGQWLNDFQWYEVLAGGREGFVWGGNFCVHGDDIWEGTGGNC